MTGQSHDYKRQGTTTLFAALNVASGKAIGRHYKRRRRAEFLDFMNRAVAAHPKREIHVVLDNLSTHKPTRDIWLKRHKNVHFRYTPTHASWLSQIEIWFSILTGQSLNGASFTSVKELIEHIAARRRRLELRSAARGSKSCHVAAFRPNFRQFLWAKARVCAGLRGFLAKL